MPPPAHQSVSFQAQPRNPCISPERSEPVLSSQPKLLSHTNYRRSLAHEHLRPRKHLQIQRPMIARRRSTHRQHHLRQAPPPPPYPANSDEASPPPRGAMPRSPSSRAPSARCPSPPGTPSSRTAHTPACPRLPQASAVPRTPAPDTSPAAPFSCAIQSNSPACSGVRCAFSNAAAGKSRRLSGSSPPCIAISSPL